MISGMVLICPYHSLFDGDETVTLIVEKAAGLAHTDAVHPSPQTSIEEVK
jgi:hypothetical protein